MASGASQPVKSQPGSSSPASARSGAIDWLLIAAAFAASLLIVWLAVGEAIVVACSGRSCMAAGATAGSAADRADFIAGLVSYRRGDRA
jgi:hypothetical protein